MKKYFTFILIIASFARAQEVTVEMMTHDLSPAKKSGFEYVSKSKGAVNPKYRDLFFENVGLAPAIEKYDEVEKNVLYFRLKRFEASRLKKLYPNISFETLEKAHAILGEQS